MRGVNGVRVDIERRRERCVAQPLFRSSPAPGVVEQGRVDVAELMPVPSNNSIRLLRRVGGQCNWANGDVCSVAKSSGRRGSAVDSEGFARSTGDTPTRAPKLLQDVCWP